MIFIPSGHMSQIPPAAQYLSLDERKMLMRHNNGIALFELAIHWLTILGTFYIIYIYPSIFVIIPCLFILAGKQLGCAVLMHDSSHHSVFSNKKLNDFVGTWIGYLLFNKMQSYRPYHKLHHVTTGTIEDPDLLLTRGYPTSRMSMIRKFSRDLFGITGFKSSIALLMMSLGYIKYTQAGVIEKTKKEDRKINWMGLIGPVISNSILFALLAVLFDPRIYLFWLLAYFTTFQFCVRVRAMAEHSMVEDTTDPMKNTRTTKANFIERMLFAPYHVNYHLEHHMLMTVPSYNLPKMHQLLVDRGYYEHGLLANGYWEVIKQAASK